MNLLIGIFTFILILVSIFLVLVVLMQKAKSDGGVAAMGGGAAESAFGAETGNILTGATIKAAIAFFVISFGLYLAHVYQSKQGAGNAGELPKITAPATTAPQATTPAAPSPEPAATNPPASEPKKN
jgi:preprotein translocase subunit SecG